MRRKGFTLIELMVVISIISLLSSIVLASLSEARGKAKIGAAQSELIQLRNAIHLLAFDTGKWPKGCPPEAIVGVSNEIFFNDPQSGVIDNAPTCTCDSNGDNCSASAAVCTFANTCEWTPEEVAKWNGPYMKSPLDPYGTAYQFDSDYSPRANIRLISSSAICAPYPVGDPLAAARFEYGCPDNPPFTPNASSCSPLEFNKTTVALVSFGKNKIGLYDCDDVYLKLK